jgi:hypothetical protein
MEWAMVYKRKKKPAADPSRIGGGLESGCPVTGPARYRLTARETLSETLAHFQQKNSRQNGRTEYEQRGAKVATLKGRGALSVILQTTRRLL